MFKKIDMSVHIGDVLQDAGLEPASTLEGRPNHSLAALTAGLVTSEEQLVKRSPQPDDISHGEVLGKKSRARQLLFARAARFEVLQEDALDPQVRAKVQEARTQ